MNPAAKEFVPAHILKKRQEEAKCLENLTEQMDKVAIKKEGGEKENDSKEKEKSNHEDSGGNEYGGECPENLHDLEEEEDDRFLLKAGENICEFNGEQFIIPGDDECEAQVSNGGYDFGNAEDNEDEDVCNAFEEFLGALPDQE